MGLAVGGVEDVRVRATVSVERKQPCRFKRISSGEAVLQVSLNLGSGSLVWQPARPDELRLRRNGTGEPFACVQMPKRRLRSTNRKREPASFTHYSTQDDVTTINVSNAGRRLVRVDVAATSSRQGCPPSPALLKGPSEGPTDERPESITPACRVRLPLPRGGAMVGIR